MSTRLERIEVFQDTQSWIQEDSDLRNSILQAKQNTQVFMGDDYPNYCQKKQYQMRLTVTKNRSFQAAMELHHQNPNSKIAVMNFANAFQAGGDVAQGSGAQEECLCRTSTLYPLLYRKTLRDSFYHYHHKVGSLKASDALIYTEGVIICKTDEDLPKRMPKEDWISVDVITIAAPNLRLNANVHASLEGNDLSMSDVELFGYHVKRMIHMLTCVYAKGADTLVLGAFGCGAFKNNPTVVAKAFKVALGEFSHAFQRVEFAVYCPLDDDTNYQVFKKILLG